MDQDHYNKLMEGVPAWNEWRKNNRDIVPDLSSSNLEKENLQGADLMMANLEKSNLGHTNLQGVNLNGANINHAIMWHANLMFAQVPHIWPLPLDWGCSGTLSLLISKRDTKRPTLIFPITNQTHKTLFS